MPETLTPWSDLPPERQAALRADYAQDPACQTGTCALGAKRKAFADWLAARGVAFLAADLPGRPRGGAR